jgi:hypothetical protein
MAGSFKKGAIPPDPRVVIPKLEDDRNGISINGQSLRQLITDGKNVRG